MADDIEPLIFDFVEWVAREPRRHADVMDTWRTSCPRLTVWEDAVERGLVERKHQRGVGAVVCVTTKGQALLTDKRPARPPSLAARA